jgi:pSer/pThr/pTyr-binding forkhead associated (FHA) protein
MTKELMQIDRSALEQLARIRQDEEVLRDRLTKAEAAKANVSTAVYERVVGDYTAKLQDIERQAKPLKDAARQEYWKLKGLEAEYGKALQDVTVDKEELEFRNLLGEFAESEFASKMTEFEERVAEQRSRVDAAAALKEQFVSAFSSEEEVESVPPPEPAPPTVTPAPSPQRSAAPTRQDTVADNVPIPKWIPSPVTEPLAIPSMPEEGDALTIATRMVAPLAPEVKARVTKPRESGATTVFSMPRLVTILDGQPGDEYVLKAKTSIGRTSKNDIQVLDDSVSRAHCEISVGRDGYHVIDLGSHNGVAVNGEKVKDRVLADGDIVDVGTRRFIFRYN